MSELFPEQWRIPSFVTHELEEKSNNYCVCVFVINEGERFHNQLARMKLLSKDIDIIIADGGSNDGSTDLRVLRNYGVKHSID